MFHVSYHALGPWSDCWQSLVLFWSLVLAFFFLWLFAGGDTDCYLSSFFLSWCNFSTTQNVNITSQRPFHTLSQTFGNFGIIPHSHSYPEDASLGFSIAFWDMPTWSMHVWHQASDLCITGAFTAHDIRWPTLTPWPTTRDRRDLTTDSAWIQTQ